VLRIFKKIIPLLFIWVSSISQNTDTIFFQNLKAFYSQKSGHSISPALYTKWAQKTSSPTHYVYISHSNKVSNALAEDNFIYCGQDSEKAAAYSAKYRKSGYSVFDYMTFGTSDALITSSLLNYMAESRAFVVFHELTHNYFKEKKISINYLLNEAASDVTGVQFCKLLCSEKKSLDQKKLGEQVKRLEAIYFAINETVEKIAADSSKCGKYCRQARRTIKKQLKNSDAFYKDRFNYPVNTAYLLKNQNYCKYYFTVNDIYKQSRDYAEFTERLLELNKKL
jgi:predicted aminopeptidase